MKQLLKYFTIHLALFHVNLMCSQNLIWMNDSNLFKKELFAIQFNDATENKLERVYSFREFVSTSTTHYFKSNNEIKSKLLKHLPKKVINQIYNLRESEMPYTSWLDVFKDSIPDSIVFIKPNALLQFYYFQDSLLKNNKLTGKNL